MTKLLWILVNESKLKLPLCLTKYHSMKKGGR